MTPLWKSLLAALVALPLIAFGLGSALADSGERGDRSPVVIEVDEDLGGTTSPGPTPAPSLRPSPSASATPGVRPQPRRTTEPGVRVVKPTPAPVPRDDDDDDDDRDDGDDGDDDGDDDD